TDDDVKRLLVVARLRPVQDELVIDQVGLDAARFQCLRGFDVLLVEFGEEVGRKLEPLAALVILLRALAGEFVEDFIQLGHLLLSCPAKAGHPVNSSAHDYPPPQRLLDRPPSRTMTETNHRIKLTEPRSPNSCASRTARRSAIFSLPPWRLSL